METWSLFLMVIVGTWRMGRGKQFCSNHPETFFCQSGLPGDLDEECGDPSNVKVQTFNAIQLVRDINKLRANLAQGRTDFEGVKFPSAGDMIEIEWNDELEKGAQNYVRTCPEVESPRPQRIIDHVLEVNELLYHESKPMMISERPFWEQALTKWKSDELADMKPYIGTKSKPKGNLELLIYGKQRYIGCGKVTFLDNTDQLWKAYIVCHLSPAGLTASFYDKGKTPCSTCPKKTKCSTQGRFQGILCAWSYAGVKLTPNLSLVGFYLMITFLFNY